MERGEKIEDSSILAYFKNVTFDTEGCTNFWKRGGKVWVKMEKMAILYAFNPLFPSDRFGEGAIDHF